MEPANIRFGGGATHTVLAPVVAVALVIAVIFLFLLPRKYALIPWFLTAIFVPFGQVLVLGGVHFTAYRIVTIFGLLRLCTARRSPGTARLPGGFTKIDNAFTLCALFSFVSFTFQWMEMQALIKSLGTLLDTLGSYFVLRFLIEDSEGVRRALRLLAVISVILAICMASEQITRKDLFAMLDQTLAAVPIRDGQVRSMGPFENYITAGVFGATLLPLFIWLSSNRASKAAGFFGIIGATIVTVTASSSTPLLAYVAGIVGLCLWPVRKRMRVLRWEILLATIAIQLCMNAPVWALIARVDLTGSSSGFHRYMLVDQCVRHLSDWWLIGAKNYDQWGPDLWDLSNQYVAYALRGGLITLVMFILIISRSFGQLGTARRLAAHDRRREWFLWCLGAALFSHLVAYFGVSYFDQMQALWYALLAMIAVTVTERRDATVSYSTRVRLSPTSQIVSMQPTQPAIQPNGT